MNEADASVPAAIAGRAAADRAGHRGHRRPAGARRAAALRGRRHGRPHGGARRVRVPAHVRHRRPSWCGRSSPAARRPSLAAQEGAEDDVDGRRGGHDGRAAIRPLDAVVGIAASGRTPFVIGALRARPRPRRAHRRPVVQRRRAHSARGVELPDRGARRARGAGRLDAAQGRHRAEAGAEHDLDHRHGPAGQDVRAT